MQRSRPLPATARQRGGQAALLALGLMAAAGAGPAVATAGAGLRFTALACTDVDLRCPVQPPAPALAVLAAAPAAGADLLALLRAVAPAGGAEVGAGAWLLALGPLQPADQPPLLQGWRRDGHLLQADIGYRAHSAVGQAARRYVPVYGAVLLPLPALPAGDWQLRVRWHADGAVSSNPGFSAGPLPFSTR